MITQFDFEQVHRKRYFNVERLVVNGKVKTRETVQAGVVAFLQNRSPVISADMVSGVTWIMYVFKDQLGAGNIQQNDFLTDEATGDKYEVTTDPNLKDQNLDYEPFYRLTVERRYEN